MITDRLPLHLKRESIEKALKQSLSRHAPPSLKYRVFHHASASHAGLQMVDYLSWAVFRKWEENDLTYYNLVKKAIRSETDLLRKGAKYYY